MFTLGQPVAAKTFIAWAVKKGNASVLAFLNAFLLAERKSGDDVPAADGVARPVVRGHAGAVRRRLTREAWGRSATPTRATCYARVAVDWGDWTQPAPGRRDDGRAVGGGDRDRPADRARRWRWCGGAGCRSPGRVVAVLVSLLRAALRRSRSGCWCIFALPSIGLSIDPVPAAIVTLTLSTCAFNCRDLARRAGGLPARADRRRDVGRHAGAGRASLAHRPAAGGCGPPRRRWSTR